MAATTNGGVFFSQKIKYDSPFILWYFAPQCEVQEDYPPGRLLHNENGAGLTNEVDYFICCALDAQRFWVIPFKEVSAITLKIYNGTKSGGTGSWGRERR
jgi:hypothetical protein